MSAESKVTMTRVIVGVASVGATLGFIYLYNKYQGRKGQSSSSSGTGTTSGSRMRRQSAKSGEVKKVTFKTDSDCEKDDAKSMSNSSAPNCKSLSQELVKEPSSVLKTTPVVASHDAIGNRNDDSIRVEQSSLSSAHLTARDDSSSYTATNSYENNSTLKLEDSTFTVINNTTNNVSAQPVVTPAAAVEEVITRSKGGPLMTSTPLPGKDSSGHVPLRAAAAVFEPHSSDLPSSSAAQRDDGKQSSSLTPETDYDAYQYRKEMKIPREIVPGLIGKKGCNIKGIQAQTGTSINFHDETMENGDRLCVIKGAPANVTIAESLIEKFILDQPTVYSETLSVPLSSVGRIIGRGGETIRQIQELSKARVNVESHNHYGSGDASGPPTKTITIKGSEEQIKVAKCLVYEKVEEERSLRKNIESATAGRTLRRGGGASPSVQNAPGTSGGTASASVSSESVLPLKQDGILEVFVSCVYHPNDFWIQVVGRDAIELDKLCENMTDHYKIRQKDLSDPQEYNVGDIVAAPFEVDGKIYRAKIMRKEDNGVEVSYLDYGDRRVLSTSEIFELDSKFLQLRFQAIQATLNLGCIGEKWEDEVINEFCDLTYCAQWQSLTAKVKNYLKDVEDGHDVICIELLDKDTNIGEELIRKGHATPRGPSGVNGAQGVQKKSYAAVALGVSSSTAPSGPVISSSDPTLQESMESDRNGN